MPLVRTDDKGNVILLVQNTIKLRLSSKIFSVASKPFAAMFGPSFAEGQGLDGAQAKDIPLPEDDAEAFEVLCKYLHHKSSDLVLKELNVYLLISLGVLIDKYDLKVAWPHHVLKKCDEFPSTKDHWLSKTRSKSYSGDRIEKAKKDLLFVVASYLLEDPVAFREASKEIVLATDSEHNFLALARGNLVFDIPACVPGTLFRK